MKAVMMMVERIFDGVVVCKYEGYSERADD